MWWSPCRGAQVCKSTHRPHIINQLECAIPVWMGSGCFWFPLQRSFVLFYFVVIDIVSEEKFCVTLTTRQESFNDNHSCNKNGTAIEIPLKNRTKSKTPIKLAYNDHPQKTEQNQKPASK